MRRFKDIANGVVIASILAYCLLHEHDGDNVAAQAVESTSRSDADDGSDPTAQTVRFGSAEATVAVRLLRIRVAELEGRVAELESSSGSPPPESSPSNEPRAEAVPLEALFESEYVDTVWAPRIERGDCVAVRRRR